MERHNRKGRYAHRRGTKDLLTGSTDINHRGLRPVKPLTAHDDKDTEIERRRLCMLLPSPFKL